MPISVLTSDIAVARAGDRSLVLWYTALEDPPGYVVIVRDAAGREIERLGPFEWEDQALDAAEARFGALSWSTH